MPNTDPLLRPIMAYINAASWETAYTLLQQDPGHLLSDNGTRLLHSSVVSTTFLAEQQPALAPLATLAREREAFHTRARTIGLDEAWLERQQGGSGEVERGASTKVGELPLDPSQEPQLLIWLQTETYDIQRAMLAAHPKLWEDTQLTILRRLVSQAQGHPAESYLSACLIWLETARDVGLEAGWLAFQMAMRTAQEVTSSTVLTEETAARRLLELLEEWLSTTTYGAQRIMLAEHPELLDPRLNAVMKELITRQQDPSTESYLHACLLWLQTARHEGLEAGWKAFHKIIGMQEPTYPSDLQPFLDELTSLTRPQDMPQRIVLLRQALQLAEAFEIEPTLMADLYGELGNSLQYSPLGERRANLEEAIDCYQRALQIYRLDQFPMKYALTQNSLGPAYVERIAGEHRANLEEAIACFQRALQVYNLDQFPEDYAMTQHNLGNTYARRIAGNRSANQEESIACFQRALQVYSISQSTEDYAMTQISLGNTYVGRIAGDRSANLEESIACFQRALQVYSLDHAPSLYAMTLLNMSDAYRQRIAGEQQVNLEEAIVCLHNALQVYTLNQFPQQHSAIQNNLGSIYHQRIVGRRQENLEKAIDCYERALQIRTLDRLPMDYRDTQLNLAWTAMDALAKDAQLRGDKDGIHTAYQRAHAAFLAAREAQMELGWLASDALGRALLLREHPQREQYARDAWCCWQLGDLRGAILALEAGRAQALVEAQSLANVMLQGITPALAQTFILARDALATARLVGGDVRAVRQKMLEARGAIRASGHTEFLPGEPTWDEVCAAPATGQVLAYVAATDEGGLLLVVPPNDEPWGIGLPALTWQRVDNWFIHRDAAQRIVSGYQYAVHHQSVDLLLAAIWDDIREDATAQEQRLHLTLEQIAQQLDPAFVTIHTVLRGLLQAWEAEANLVHSTAPNQATQLRTRGQTPIGDLLRSDFFVQELHWQVLCAELDHILEEISTCLAQPLRAALEGHGLGDDQQLVALIPCGRLGMLPLHAARARADGTPLLETCDLTFQPAARTLFAARQALATMPMHGPVLAVGDPWPTWIKIQDAEGQVHEHIPAQLLWAAAEADGIATLSPRANPPRPCTLLTGLDATGDAVRAHLLRYAQDKAGAWVQIAAHGSADPTDPQRSAMLLAHGQRLSLADLQQEDLLRGVRLFNASGCVTGLGDIRTAPDELNSFAGGVLQAGAAGALATLWSVSDQATFALMFHFAQVWLGTQAITPSQALRHAVHWLRTVSHSEIDSLKKLVRSRIKGLDLATTGPDRDIERGMDLLEGDRSHLTIEKTSVVDALAELGDYFRFHHSNVTPFAHPYFWAAFIVYGA